MLMETYLKNRTENQLKEELKQLNDMIDVLDCFSVGDLMLRDSIAKDLYERKNKWKKLKQL